MDVWGGDKAGLMRGVRAALKSKVPVSWKCKLDFLEGGGRGEVRLSVLEGDLGFWGNVSVKWDDLVRYGLVGSSLEDRKRGCVVIGSEYCDRVFSGQYGGIVRGILLAMEGEIGRNALVDFSICLGYRKGRKEESYKVGGVDVFKVLYGER